MFIFLVACATNPHASLSPVNVPEEDTAVPPSSLEESDDSGDTATAPLADDVPPYVLFLESGNMANLPPVEVGGDWPASVQQIKYWAEVGAEDAYRLTARPLTLSLDGGPGVTAYPTHACHEMCTIYWQFSVIIDSFPSHMEIDGEDLSVTRIFSVSALATDLTEAHDSL